MSEIKRFENIPTNIVNKIGVQALADRPNAGNLYGKAGMSPIELKKHFDNMAVLLINKINSLQETFSKEEVAQYVRIALDEYSVENLQDFIDAIFNGTFAERMLSVYPTLTDTDKMPLQKVIYDINKKIVDEIEGVKKTLTDLGYGYTGADVVVVEDGGDVGASVEVVDKDGEKILVFTLRNYGKAVADIALEALDYPLDKGESSYSLKQQAPSLRNNEVLSQSSVAFGENCVAGCMGYYISEIYYGDTSNDPQVRLSASMPILRGMRISASKLTATSPFPRPLYPTGAKFNITCGNHYFHLGTIKSINSDVITFTGDMEVFKSGLQSKANEGSAILTSTSFTLLVPGTDDYTLWSPSNPTIGLVSVSALCYTEGCDNISSGVMGHSEGRENVTGGAYGHTEGRGNLAGYGAHAEGYLTQATDKYTHSEGWNTRATATAAHAEGRDCKATAFRSHAEGWNTEAKAVDSHAEGRDTIASGGRAHAEGYMTEASGADSHAGGRGTKATATAQTAIGKYNKENPDALLIVGNGTSDTARSNAFEVLKDGTLVGDGVLQMAMGTFTVAPSMSAELHFDFYPRIFITDTGSGYTERYIEENTKVIYFSHSELKTVRYIAIGNTVPYEGNVTPTTTFIVKDTSGKILIQQTTDVVNPYVTVTGTTERINDYYYNKPIIQFNGKNMISGTLHSGIGSEYNTYSLSIANDGNATSEGDLLSVTEWVDGYYGGYNSYIPVTVSLTVGKTHTYYLIKGEGAD